jgi:hypothetical protein
VIHGIADHFDWSKSDLNQALAARNAATVLAALLPFLVAPEDEPGAGMTQP